MRFCKKVVKLSFYKFYMGKWWAWCILSGVKDTNGEAP